MPQGTADSPEQPMGLRVTTQVPHGSIIDHKALTKD
jgi:hypothetical protein